MSSRPTRPDSEEIRTKVAVLENDIKHINDNLTSINENIKGILGELKNTNNNVAARTSASRVATWLFIGPVIAAAVGLSGFFYTNILPDKIEGGITNSNSLKERFESINTQLKDINDAIKPLINSQTFAAALTDTTSVDESVLARTLPETKHLLSTVRKNKVPLKAQDYKNISEPLFNHYSASKKQDLKHEIWGILVDLAKTRSATDASIHPVPPNALETAKNSENYYQGSVDLAEKLQLKDTIFDNCNISIGYPGFQLILSNVRFIDCDFQELKESEINRNFLEAVLTSPEPAVNVTLVNHPHVDHPKDK